MTNPGVPQQVSDSTAVEHLVQVLVKGLRAIQLYLPNNPIYQKAVANLQAAFGPVWEEHSELHLRVTESDLLWEDVAVYSEPSKADSLAWVLFKDGLRSLTLAPGVEDGEIISFLEVIQRARALPADAPDDLLTLLWEQDLLRIRYTAIELGEEGVDPLQPSEEGWLRSEPPGQETVREQVQEESQEAAAGIVSIEDFDSTLYFLDDAELKYLKQEIDREYSQDLRTNVLAMLFDLLELQVFTTVRAELINILENFIPYLLAASDFRSVAYLLRELRVVLERAREVLPDHRQQLTELPAKLSQPEPLGQLLQSLDEAVVHPTEEQLSGLFGELRPEALQNVLQWLPRLSSEQVRALLHRAAERLAQTHPDQVVRTLEEADDAVLLQTLRLVGHLKLPPFVPPLGTLLKRDTVEVRQAAAEALAAVGSPGAMKELLPGVEDDDRDVRITAVRALAERGYRGAFEKIEAAVSGKGMRAADLTEKTAFFEAYGMLAGSSGIESLRALLQGKGMLRRREDPETRACAAMALGKINDPEARRVLESAANDKDPLVKNAINRALRERGRDQ